MTQEEKASAYDVLLTKAKQIYNKENDVLIIHTIEDLFPEVRKNEDERIRKALISILKSDFEEDTKIFGISVGKIIAWLEKQSNTNKEYWRGYREGKQEILDKYAKLKKQGELKETLCEKCKKAQPSQSCQDITALGRCAVEHEQKVEPKFHEGEWITNGDYTWKIVEVKPLYYILQSQDGNIIVDDTISHADEHFHSFTIEDAKEGDVLTYKNDNVEWILIYKDIITESCDVPHDVLRYHALFTGTVFYDSGCAGMISENYALCFTPATKEQRDALEWAMSIDGYKWDKEKLKLEKYE